MLQHSFRGIRFWQLIRLEAPMSLPLLDKQYSTNLHRGLENIIALYVCADAALQNSFGCISWIVYHYNYDNK